MVETPALPPGAWGPGRACGSGTGGSACTRILVLVELSMVQAQLSAEVDAAPGQGTGSLCGALCFPGGGPRSHLCPLSRVKQAKQLDSVMPATLCSCRAQSKLFPGARGSSGNKVRWWLGSVCPGWKASAFPGHWGKERDLAGMGCEAGLLPAKRLPGHRTQGASK